MCLPFCCGGDDQRSPSQGTHNRIDHGNGGRFTGKEANNDKGTPAGVAPRAYGNMNKSGEGFKKMNSPTPAPQSPEDKDQKRTENMMQAPKQFEHVVSGPSHQAGSVAAAPQPKEATDYYPATMPPELQIAHRGCEDDDAMASSAVLSMVPAAANNVHGDDHA